MGIREFRIIYGDPDKEKRIEGETFSIDEDGHLHVFDADNKCILIFSSIVWTFIEDITNVAYAERDSRKAFAK